MWHNSEPSKPEKPSVTALLFATCPSPDIYSRGKQNTDSTKGMMKMNKALDTYREYIKGKKLAVIGAGISNRPLLEWLYPMNPDITVFDMMKEEDERLRKIKDHFDKQEIQLTWITGDGYLDHLQGFDIIFRTPKMHLDLPQLIREKEKGAVIDSEIALFAHLCPAPIYGITGSDGKSTTTTLISLILEAAGHKVFTGGNIGTPLIGRIGEVQAQDRVVLELSSFQLMDMEEEIDVAVITNVIPNHLDFHKDFDEYVEAKKNIFKYQGKDKILVLNAQDPMSVLFKRESKSELRLFNVRPTDRASAWREEDKLWLSYPAGSPPRYIMDETQVLLPGSFNLENLLAAASATAGDVPLSAVKEVGESFRGVPHRMELVGIHEGVRWFNSSVDSSPSRTIKTLSAFRERNESLILITGGQDKNSDYTGLGRAIARTSNRIIISGENAGQIESILKEESARAGVPYEDLSISRTDSYEEAVQLARTMAFPGDAVLFSPAGTSYDRYHHFEERGNHFRKMVEKLAE